MILILTNSVTHNKVTRIIIEKVEGNEVSFTLLTVTSIARKLNYSNQTWHLTSIFGMQMFNIQRQIREVGHC